MVLAFSLVFVFVVGVSVGSFLNVAAARLPLEKSLLWPNSRCGSCLQAIRWYDNIPLVSYLSLRGHCRTCGQTFSISYFLVELGTGLAFVGLFCGELVLNVHGWPRPMFMVHGLFPWTWCVGFAWHATLMAFLIAASVCDLRSREIPLQLTLTGTLVGLIGAVLMPWPFPQDPSAAAPPVVPPVPAALAWQMGPRGPLEGIYAWPFWGPLPAWADAGGNWQTGLATGVLGALVGTFLLRTIGFLFSTGLGKEALGLGDADLMMMAGAFLGWQIVVVAFFLSVFPALIIGVLQLLIRRDNSLPFGPSLSLSVLATCLLWRWISEPLRPVFFFGTFLFWLAAAAAGAMLLMSYAFRLLRRETIR